MTTTVSDIFKKFDLIINGQVKWNAEIDSDLQGVYVIALTHDRDKLIVSDEPDFDDIAIEKWIELIKIGHKEMLVDGKPATIELIKQRLSHSWFPDETIVYIGKVGPTKRRTFRKRLNEYYRTTLGCNRKHAGGHWVNTLKNLSELNIFYSETNPAIEESMIEYFCMNVSDESKSKLYDKINCYPFANKELNKSVRKEHGLLYQTIDCGKNWKKST